MGFPGGSVVKNLPVMQSCRRRRFDPWFGKMPWRRAWQPNLVYLLGDSRWTEEPGGYSPWDSKESDMTEQLSLINILNIFYNM